MTQILVGSAANDGTGDPLRTAFLRINQYGILNDKTVNAAFYKTSSNTNEAAITLAIVAAALLGTGAAVWVPQSMLPYNASLVTFNNAVKMLREGANPAYFDVRAYGAYGDGITNDQPQIQAALDAALGSSAVSFVYVSSGTYLLGPGGTPGVAGAYSLKIGSNVTVWLDAGATLVRNFVGGANVNATLRNADQAAGNTNIGIIGNGVIKTTNASNTGKHLGFTKCSQLNFRDVQFLGVYNDWNIFLSDCTDSTINGLYINSGTTVSTDGLHLEGGGRIVVTNCFIKCGDDAISLSQDSNFATTDLIGVVVSNCYLDSLNANNIRIWANTGQSPSNRAIRKIAITNCVFGAGAANGQGFIIYDATNTGLISDINITNVVYDASGNTGVLPIDGALRVSIENMKIISPTSRLQIDRCTDIELIGCEITGMRGGSAQCVLIASLGACTNVKIIGGHYKGGTSHNIYTGAGFAATDIVIEGVTTEGSSNDGIFLGANTAGALVKGNRSKGNTGNGIGIQAGAATITLEGNDVRGNTGGTILDAGTNTYKNRNRFSTGPLSGRAVLVGGTVTVATAEVVATDNVQLTRVVAGGTARGHLTVGAIVAGTSFVITAQTVAAATEANDTSTVLWEIVH